MPSSKKKHNQQVFYNMKPTVLYGAGAFLVAVSFVVGYFSAMLITAIAADRPDPSTQYPSSIHSPFLTMLQGTAEGTVAAIDDQSITLDRNGTQFTAVITSDTTVQKLLVWGTEAQETQAASIEDVEIGERAFLGVTFRRGELATASRINLVEEIVPEMPIQQMNEEEEGEEEESEQESEQE